MKVGTKELKNRLSHYLRLVRDGERVQVTHQGTVVAEIRAATSAKGGDQACLQALERDGVATRGEERRPSDFAPLVAAGKKRRKLLSQLVHENRD